MMEMSHKEHLVTLAMLITGIVIGRNAQLSRISAEVPADAKDKSVEIQRRKWVEHAGIEPDIIYMVFARQILEALSGAPLILVMDGSQVGRGFVDFTAVDFSLRRSFLTKSRGFLIHKYHLADLPVSTDCCLPGCLPGLYLDDLPGALGHCF